MTRPGTRGSTSEEAPVMGVELREPGRWIRDEDTEGIRNVESAKTAKQDGQTQGPMAMGCAFSVDEANAASSGQRSKSRQMALAKCILCQPQAVHDDYSQSAGCSVPIGTTDWRAGCGKSASPVRREGRPGDKPAVPTPDRKSTRLNSSHQCLSRMPSSA